MIAIAHVDGRQVAGSRSRAGLVPGGGLGDTAHTANVTDITIAPHRVAPDCGATVVSAGWADR